MKELGSFLRARRGSVDVAAAGVPTYGHRRVPGLRREEVAVLAGVNVDYYAKLEQGRETGPSAQVLDALARVLDLDAPARDHLFRLAGVAPYEGSARLAQQVSPALRQLLDGWTTNPALVIDRTLDVLASNALAAALFSPFTLTDNLVRMVFLDPAGRPFYRDWGRAAQSTVASLRVATGYDPRDPGLEALVAEVSSADEDFAGLWASEQVRGKTVESKDLVHPHVGPLHLTTLTFTVAEAPQQQLVVYSAEPGSTSAQSLDLLASLNAPARSETDAHT